MSNAATPTEPAKTTAPSAPAPVAHATTTTEPPAAPAAKKATKKAPAKKAAAKKSSAKKSASSTPPPEVRSAAQIQADIDAAQERLASHVDELSDRLNPQHLAEEAVGGVKRIFVHSDGTPKVKPIAIVGGGLAALVVLRKIFHRG